MRWGPALGQVAEYGFAEANASRAATLAVVGRDPGDASSVQLYNDLFLVLRALGADRARPGEPSLYQPAARLLLTPESERTEELRAAAARDVANNAHRLRLLERIDGDLAASL